MTINYTDRLPVAEFQAYRKALTKLASLQSQNPHLKTLAQIKDAEVEVAQTKAKFNEAANHIIDSDRELACELIYVAMTGV